MPKIPEFNSRVGLIPEAPPGPDISPASSGRGEEALKNLGDTAFDSSMKLIEMRKRADDASEAHQNSLQDKLDAEDYSQKLKLSLGSDLEGYSQGMHDWTQDRFETRRKAARSDESRQMYESLSGTLFANEVVQAKQTEFQARAVARVENLKSMSRMQAGALVENPNVPGSYDTISRLDLATDAQVGTSLTGAMATTQKQIHRNEVAEGVLRGLYQKAEASDKDWMSYARQGLAVLKGMDPESKKKPEGQKLSDYLTPDQHNKLLHDFNAFVDTKKELNASEVRRSVQDEIVNARTGGPSNPNVMKDIDLATQMGALPKEEAIRSKHEILMAGATRDSRAEMASKPGSAFDNIIAGNEDRVTSAIRQQAAKDPSLKNAMQPGFNAAATQKYKAELVAAAHDIMKARAEDPVQFTTEQPAFANVANMMSSAGDDPDKNAAALRASHAAQQAQGIVEPRVTSKSQAAKIADGLSDPNPEIATQAFSRFENKYGSYWSRAFNEVMADKKIDPGLWLAHYVKSPDERITAVGMVQNAKEIDQTFKAQHPETTTHTRLESELKSQLQDYLAPIAQISDKGGSAELTAGLYKLAETAAKNEMRPGGTSDPRLAAERASQIIKRNYQTIQAAGSTVIAPVQVNANVARVFMEENLKEPDISQLELPKLRPGEKRTDDELQTALIDNIRSGGHWEMVPTLDAVKLVVTVKGGAKYPVRKKDGSLYVVPFDKMLDEPKTSKRVGQGGLLQQSSDKYFSPDVSIEATDGH
jgi:hypothetical protein